MIIYGTKNIPLKTLKLPHSCLSCGSKNLEITFYCTCLSLFFIPFLPYRKRALVHCTNCGAEEKIKKPFNGISSKKEIESCFKETRAPRYLFITTGIAVFLIGTLAAFYVHKESQVAAQVASYSKKPISNALLVIKVKDEAYPYNIAYVPEVNDQEAILFVWNYAYLELRDARKELSSALKSLHSSTVESNFSEPYVIPLKDFSEFEFAYINLLEKELDWKTFIPENPSIN